MDRSYIKLFRSLRTSDIWTDSAPFCKRAAWVDLLMIANHRPGVAKINTRTIQVKRGQVCRALRTLAEAWRWSPNKVRRFLGELERAGMIERTEIKTVTVITIVNYEAFQSGENGTLSGTANGTANGTLESAKTEQSKPAKIGACSAETGEARNAEIDPNGTANGTANGTLSGNIQEVKNIQEEYTRAGARDVDPDFWTPDNLTRQSLRMQLGPKFEITDKMIVTFRPRIADWQDKGFFAVNLRQKFMTHCKEIANGENLAANHRPGDQSLVDDLDDDSWID